MLKVSLRFRIFLIIACMAGFAAVGTIALTFYSLKTNTTLSSLVGHDFEMLKTARDMEMNLRHQKAIILLYARNKDYDILHELSVYHSTFVRDIRLLMTLCDNDKQKKTLNDIQIAYMDYSRSIEMSVAVFAPLKGGLDSLQLSDAYMAKLSSVLQKCQAYTAEQWQSIVQQRENIQREAKTLSFLEMGTIMSYLALTAGLIFVLLKQVLRPVRMMALEAGGNRTESARNEVQSLSSSLHRFIEDFDFAHQELVKSREHLEQAEKMALVGKLAAGVAHSIRNPFTSIKMRLFSLSRNLEMSDAQTEDLEVISEEIRRIDNIVQNFLEFARPPKIRMEIVSLSEVIESVLQILKHRLQAFNIQVTHEAVADIPPIRIDPEQLQEALINIVINACEAMEAGGTIEIHERLYHDGEGKMVMLQVHDDGPGINETIKDKIIQPFFTTKEEGTGLGLSIVARIVEEHKGFLDIASIQGQGACFTIFLPLNREGQS